MRKILEVLRLHHEGRRSHREITRAVVASPTTVGEILRRAKLAGIDYPLPGGMTEMAVEIALYPSPARSSNKRPEPDWAAVHRELRPKGVTLDLLWQEYKAEHSDGYWAPLNACVSHHFTSLQSSRYALRRSLSIYTR